MKNRPYVTVQGAGTEARTADLQILPPYGEKGVQLGRGASPRERRMELCRWEGGWKLEGEDVASGTEEAKAA
jgi:hypothetical protein